MGKYEISYSVIVQVDDWNNDLHEIGYSRYPYDGIIVEGEENTIGDIAQKMWDDAGKVEGGEYKLMGTTEEELLELFEGYEGEDGEPITSIDECEMNHIFIDNL